MSLTEKKGFFMKKLLPFLLSLCLVFSGCAAAETNYSSSRAEDPVSGESSSESASSADSASPATVTFEDSNGDVLTIPLSPKVVCLYGSYAEAWLLAGGSLTGTTEDAIEERGLDVGGAEIVGTVKEPNAELIIGLEPDLVILNSDITPQVEMGDVLKNAGLACAYFRVDTFEDYREMMLAFCAVTGRDDLFEQNVTAPEQQIETVKSAVPAEGTAPNVLLMRAFSTGIKAKTDDELAGAILKDLGAHNIADDHPSMLEDLSLEEVIEADPDFIFVTTMGSEKKAKEYLNSRIEENPAWQELTAVKEGRYVFLPKDLFHYKPNNRWGNSYQFLAALLYPEAGIDPVSEAFE